ncbi:MAG: DUF2793 domain-containing protein [Deltaproteobacteria bacterium]|jgi:hypothetical protein|nr:DUF2793 domain-containing protein [Deltaproteobacteria bacterium]
MGGGKGDQEYTTGYRYYASVHMVLCHGPVDAVIRMIVGDKTAWSGRVSDGEVLIDQYNMFGGEDFEGGVHGMLDVMSGSPGQYPNGFLAAVLPHKEYIPAFRGVVSVVLKNFMICAVNPYPKPWRFTVQRFPRVGTIGSERIGDGANPAQIIAECLTNRQWGLGMELAELDGYSFQSAATVLSREGFGLCPRWDQTSSIEDFIGTICDIIDGQLGMDPTSGKYSLKLIREDYNADYLMTLDPSNIIRLTDFSRPDPKELVNEVVVVFENSQTGVQQSVSEKNTAALALNPAVNSFQLDYQAVPSQTLARRIALRELSQQSSGLARCTLECGREAASLRMGDCLVLTWPPLGIDRMIMRVTSMSQGSSTDWRVRIDCVQDIYGLPETEFSEVDSGWAPPDYTPYPIDKCVVYELPYYLVALFITGDNDSSWADQPEGFGYPAAVANQPSGLTSGFKVLLRNASGTWEENRKLSFCEYAHLAEDADDVQTALKINEGQVHEISPGEPFFIDGEWMAVRSYDKASGVLTAGRGCMDTVPAPHASGSWVWLTSTYNNAVRNPSVRGQTASLQLKPYSLNGTEAAASAVSLAVAGRAGMPVAPANVRVNGQYRPKALAAWASALAWARRDRQNTARLIDNTEGDYQPEDGTVYRVVIREKVFPDSAWSPASDTPGIDGISLALSGKYTPQAYALEFSLTARLGALDSFQANVLVTAHEPWAPAVLSMSQTAPPSSPAAGDMHVIPAGAGGAWAGHDLEMAAWKSGWLFHAPALGQRVTLAGDPREWDGEQWKEA